MNCKQTRSQLDDYLDGTLSQDEVKKIHDHALNCPSCHQRLGEHKKYMQSMRAMPVPEMSPGFTQRALRRAVEQKQHQRQGFTRGFGSALVAGLAMWAVVAVFMPANEPMQGALANVSLDLYQESTVNLVFYSPKAVANARLSISVPENIEVIGFGEQREISWQTSLQQGKNILPLPLRAKDVSSAELMASIESGDNKKMFRVNINVTDGKQTELPKSFNRA